MTETNQAKVLIGGEPPTLKVLDRWYGTNGIIFSTADWFSRHEPFWNSIIRENRPRRILEIGSYEGRSTCYMIQECTKYNPIEIWCVDTWLGGEEHAGENFIQIETRFDNNIKLISTGRPNEIKFNKMKGYSCVKMSELLLEFAVNYKKDEADGYDPRFDLIYIDGSHRASDVFLDAAMAFALLKPGGILIFDDYRVLDNPRTEYDIPTIAIDAFLTVHRNKIEVLRFETDDERIIKEFGGVIPETDIYQLYLKKIGE